MNKKIDRKSEIKRTMTISKVKEGMKKWKNEKKEENIKLMKAMKINTNVRK